MKHTFRLAISTLLFTGSFAAAQSTQPNGREMDGIELSSAFNGMTMVGNYGNGVKFTETYLPDGSIDYSDDQSKDRGHWFVRGRLFCTFYEKSNGACFSVKKSGDNCYEYFTQEEEDGSIHADAGAWNSVGWDQNKQSSCDLADKTS
jgi:hypothetical protein